MNTSDHISQIFETLFLYFAPTPRQPQQEPERSAPGFSILRERHTSHEPRSGPSDYISTATNPHKLHQALTRQREMIERQQDELNW